jgi:hypothetical protein
MVWYGGHRYLCSQWCEEGFDLDVFEKPSLYEMVDARVRAREEVTWLEKEDEMVLVQG